MSTHAELIERFYTAFAKRDAETMVACYHPQVRFSDPVFGHLGAREVAGMWRMLCERAQEFSLEFSDIHVEGDGGTAHWEARYLFTATGRRVHNVIDASFRFADDAIVEHHDVFNFYRWSRQALGLPGILLGWTPVVRNKVRGQARSGLDRYLAEHGESV